MKTIIQKSLLAAVALFILEFVGFKILTLLFQSIAEQYFNPIFNMDGYKGVLFILHPFVLSFALAWFWTRIKSLLTGSLLVRGIEFGFIYAIVAVLPSMWMILSALNVTPILVLTWLLHGFIQGSVVGIIYAKLNP